MLSAVGSDDRPRPDLVDRIGYERHVGAGHRRVEVVGDQHPLAAQGVEGIELEPQGGILDLTFLEGRRQFLAAAHELGLVGQPQADDLGSPILQGPPHAEHSWNSREHSAGGRRDLLIAAGQHPRRRTLKHRQGSDSRCDLGDDLDRAGSTADHGDTLAGEFDVVPPAGRVERWPLERAEPRQVRHLRHVQRPDGRHHDAGREPPAIAGREPPPHRRLVPLDPLDRRLVADQTIHTTSRSHLLEVVEDLSLRRIGPRPVRVLLKRIRIEVRRHVAAAPRIGVVAPGAAERRGLFEDDNIAAARLEQLDGHADPGKPGAEDGDAEIGCVGRGPCPPAGGRRVVHEGGK